MRVESQIIYRHTVIIAKIKPLNYLTRIHITTASHCACAKSLHISLLSILQNGTWQTSTVLNVMIFTLRCTLLSFGYEHYITLQIFNVVLC